MLIHPIFVLVKGLGFSRSTRNLSDLLRFFVFLWEGLYSFYFWT